MAKTNSQSLSRRDANHNAAQRLHGTYSETGDHRDQLNHVINPHIEFNTEEGEDEDPTEDDNMQLTLDALANENMSAFLMGAHHIFDAYDRQTLSHRSYHWGRVTKHAALLSGKARPPRHEIFQIMFTWYAHLTDSIFTDFMMLFMGCCLSHTVRDWIPPVGMVWLVDLFPGDSTLFLGIDTIVYTLMYWYIRMPWGVWCFLVKTRFKSGIFGELGVLAMFIGEGITSARLQPNLQAAHMIQTWLRLLEFTSDQTQVGHKTYRSQQLCDVFGIQDLTYSNGFRRKLQH